MSIQMQKLTGLLQRYFSICNDLNTAINAHIVIYRSTEFCTVQCDVHQGLTFAVIRTTHYSPVEDRWQ